MQGEHEAAGSILAVDQRAWGSHDQRISPLGIFQHVVHVVEVRICSGQAVGPTGWPVGGHPSCIGSGPLRRGGAGGDSKALAFLPGLGEVAHGDGGSPGAGFGGGAGYEAVARMDSQSRRQTRGNKLRQGYGGSIWHRKGLTGGSNNGSGWNADKGQRLCCGDRHHVGVKCARRSSQSDDCAIRFQGLREI